MRNPNGSDIPLARELLDEAIAKRDWDLVADARAKMTRQKPMRRAHSQQTAPITPEMRSDILSLADDLTLSNADIAELVGLPKCASGRVTEVIQGLRK